MRKKMLDLIAALVSLNLTATIALFTLNYKRVAKINEELGELKERVAKLETDIEWLTKNSKW